MMLLWDNLYDALTCTGSTERSGFPAINAQHPHLIRVWRSQTDGAEWLLFDAGEGNTITANALLVAAHNLTAGATLKWQANSSADWTAPPVDETVTVVSGNIVHKLSSSKTYRLWRVYFNDTSNPDGYIQIGRIGGYLAYVPAETPDGPSFKHSLIDGSRVSKSITKQRFSDLAPMENVYEFSMGILSEAVKEELLAIYSVMGKHTAVCIVPDENNKTKLPPLYAHMESDVVYTHAGGWAWRDEIMKFSEAF